MRPSFHHGAIRPLAFGMTTLGMATGMVLAAAAAAQATQAIQAAPSCQDAVDQAETSWRTLALQTPDKPAQAHVQEGRVPGGAPHAEPVDGALYTYLADQLRFAAASCRDGREVDARAALSAFARALPPRPGASRG